MLLLCKHVCLSCVCHYYGISNYLLIPQVCYHLWRFPWLPPQHCHVHKWQSLPGTSSMASWWLRQSHSVATLCCSYSHSCHRDLCHICHCGHCTDTWTRTSIHVRNVNMRLLTWQLNTYNYSFNSLIKTWHYVSKLTDQLQDYNHSCEQEKLVKQV